MRYTFPARITLYGDQRIASRYVNEARGLLGTLMQALGEQNLRSGQMERRRDDVAIDVSYDGTTAAIRIEVGAGAGGQPLEFDVWIPRGFVVEPANDAAPAGWGLPSHVDEDADALSPSPAPADWTANGPLPAVLLTRVPDAGYPSKTKVAAPLYFDPPEIQGDIALPDEGAVWAAYRPWFTTLGADGNAVLDELNGIRPPDSPLSLPFRGHATPASWYQRLIQKYGVSDSNYPIGSNTAAKRLTKDGTVFEFDERSPIGVIGIADTSSAATPHDVATLLVDLVPALGSDTTLKGSTTFSIAGADAQTEVVAGDYRDRWVKCGNLDWFSSLNPEIPRISWAGPQGRSIPPREMSFGLRRYSGSDLGAAMWIDEMEADFQGRKVRLFDRFVYARGRVLAQLPEDGYVLGAAVQKIPATLDRPLMYRLVVVAWHRSDQFFQSTDTGFVWTWDTTSDIRVWYAEMPVRNGLVLLPQNVIEGAYDETTNPEGWRQIAQHRLWPLAGDHANHGPGFYLSPDLDPGVYPSEAARCAPKTYWQPWFFNASGTAATCLRASAYVDTFSVLLSGTIGPVQAITLSVSNGITPTSSIELAWDLDEETATIFAPYQSEPLYYAWDYQGDDEARATFSYSDTPGDGGSTHANTTTGASLFTNELNGEANEINSEWTLWYFDARSDDYIAVDQTVHQTAAGPDFYDRVDAIEVHVGAGGSEVASFSSSVPAPYTLSYSVIGGRGDIPAWSERDEFCGIDTPNPHQMIAFARRGDDYVSGAWYGVYPGAFEGNPLDGVTTSSYSTLAHGTASSIDIDAHTSVSDGWLNFAGVA